jgi:transcriptional regulator with XRE-family HTH domain
VLKDSVVKAFCVSFSKALKTEREKKKLSMNAVAQMAGISQQMVSYIERGMRSPSLETLYRLSHALEIDPAVLIQRAVRDSED